MGKLILNTGLFMLEYNSTMIEYGLLSVNASDALTKIDVADTGNNMDLMAGRFRFNFGVTVISDSEKGIPLRTTPQIITIMFGSRIYRGRGYIFSLAEQGNLDDKVVYNIQGEFTQLTSFTQYRKLSGQWDGSAGLDPDLNQDGAADAIFPFPGPAEYQGMQYQTQAGGLYQTVTNFNTPGIPVFVYMRCQILDTDGELHMTNSAANDGKVMSPGPFDNAIREYVGWFDPADHFGAWSGWALVGWTAAHRNEIKMYDFITYGPSF